jgi:Serine/threonine protein kinase
MICQEIGNNSAWNQASEEVQCNPVEDLYQDLDFIKPLNSAKFSVYLVHSQTSKSYYAMKVFPLHHGKIVPFYYNESRFSYLSHKNVISIIDSNPHKTLEREGKKKTFSYILMELASFGDFFDLILKYKVPFNDKLIRTYFHQLIEGLEYLHSNGVCHLDIKLENLLLGNGFQLKIADFDMSYMKGDKEIRSSGTKYYRAPELKAGTCIIPEAADIFSAAIVLFLMKSGGTLPQNENNIYQGMNLYDLLQSCPKDFWAFHNDLKKQNDYYQEDFMELFTWMTRENPCDRPTISQIKEASWYNGEVYDDRELETLMKELLFDQ